MYQRITLYKRLRPEFKETLKSTGVKYPSSVGSIIKLLDNTDFYGDLKISDLSTIHTFTEVDTLRVSSWDLRYGEHLFVNRTDIELEFEQDNIDKDKLLSDD